MIRLFRKEVTENELKRAAIKAAGFTFSFVFSIVIFYIINTIFH